MLDSSPDVHPSGALGGSEDANINNAPVKGVANIQKCQMSSSLAAHHMAQCVGQRPRKILRTERASLISPVSKNHEAQISSQGFTTSNEGSGSPYGTGGSLLVNSVDNSNPNFKMKLENIPSPVALSEGEESGGGEIKLNVNGSYTGQGSEMLSSTRPAIISSREKIEDLPGTKPLQSMRRFSERNRSKSGRPPSKKMMDRKTFIHTGHVIHSGSSDFTGESDDREELLAAANYARNASKLACSGPFWKQMEPYFASITSQDASYLKHQLNLAEELNGSLSHLFGDEYNASSVLMHKDVSVYSDGRRERHSNKKSVKTDDLCGGINMRRMYDKAPTVYQRVLSAIVEEDESEELYHQSKGRIMSFQCASDDSHCGSCNHTDVELKDRDRIESEVESEVDLQAQNHCLLERISCNKSASSFSNGNQSLSSSLCNNEQWQSDVCLSYSSQADASAISSFDNQYQMLSLDDRLLLELQSIGLCLETTPHIAKGDDGINQDVMELQAGLYQQVGKVKHNLVKIDKAITCAIDMERRNMEQAAMNQLIVMASKNQMAFRRNNSSKSVIRKVSKQVASAFAKRTLDRCRKFEDIGKSCFSESTLQDVIFSGPLCNSDVKSIDCVGSRTASNRYNGSCDRIAEPRDSVTGDVPSTRKRHDSHSDRGGSNAPDAITNSSGQDCFKREPILNEGKRRKVVLDDGGGASSKATSVEVKGKRCEIDGDGNSKANSNQKANHFSTSGNGLRSSFTESSVKIPQDSSKEVEDSAGLEKVQLKELGYIDTSLLLNFNEDGLEEHDSVGLEVPMDNLSDVFFFL